MLGRGWHGALAWLLCEADANLLARHKSEIFGIKGLRKDDRDLMEMRVDLLTMKAETCWRELELIHGWLDTRPLQDVLPKSDFAEALRYIRNHWKELNVYVRDGRIPIDNNLVEQLMKQVAMGRKAWLFVCSVAGGEQSARMMTLVSSARRHDLDVRIYLKDVLDQLLAGCTDYHRLPPDVWKQSHPEAVRQYRVEERRDKAERKQLKPPAAVWPPTALAGVPKAPAAARPDMGLVTAHVRRTGDDSQRRDNALGVQRTCRDESRTEAGRQAPSRSETRDTTGAGTAWGTAITAAPSLPRTAARRSSESRRPSAPRRRQRTSQGPATRRSGPVQSRGR